MNFSISSLSQQRRYARPTVTISSYLRLLSFIVILISNSLASAEAPETHPVTVELVAEHTSLNTSDVDAQAVTTLALKFSIEPGWHIYWKNSGESAMPTKVAWTTSNGWQVGELQWPTPLRYIERGDITTFGYSNATMLLSELSANAPEAYAEEHVQVEAKVSWLVCNDVCIPGRETLELSIPIGTKPTEVSPEGVAIEKTRSELPKVAIPGVAIESEMTSTTLARSSSSELLFRVRGLTHLADSHPAPIQFFPGPSKHLRTDEPTVAWQGEELLLHTRLHSGASAPLGASTYSGILAFPAANGEDIQAVQWELPLTISEKEVQNDSALALPEDVAFTTSTYRRKHWSDAKHSKTTNNDATIASPSESPSLKDDSSQPPIEPKDLADNPGAERSFLVVLLLAFLGGMVLNLMPCVLPIIAIKVMGFIEQKKSGSKGGATAFCAGILFSFIVLAAVVITLRSLGHQLGWGFQFQHPEFVFFITLVVFILGLGFFDFYTLALPHMQRACSAVDSLEPSKLKHFFDGIIATILSTPCTAPFLGTALVFAFTQGPLATLAIHLAIGFGLATPYFILATNPKFLALLPRPGTWMHKLRQLMGFMLLGTVLWLLFVLQKLTGEGVIWTQVIMVTLVFSVWLYDWSKDWRPATKRLTHLFAAVLLAGTILSVYPKAVQRVQKNAGTAITKGELTWEPYSAKIVEETLAAGRGVFIDFTADWCITCKANEFLIINTDEVTSAIREANVQPILADWTNGEPEITAALASYGARGVPLYVVISPDAPESPTVLSTIPSKSALVEALTQARADSSQ